MKLRHVASAALACLWIGNGLVLGQEPKPDAPKQNAPAPFKDDVLRAEEPDRNALRDFRSLVTGSELSTPVSPERKKELLDKFSRWLIYRFTWPEVHEGRDGKTSVADVMSNTFGSDVDSIAKALINVSTRDSDDAAELARRQRQRDFQNEIKAAMLPRIRDVLKTSTIISRVNAARVLHRLVELGHLDVVDEVIKLLETPSEHHAVKHWCILALGEALSQPATTKDASGKDVKRLDVERVLMATYNYLDPMLKVPPTVVAEMRAEEVEAIRFLRRAAIRALGAGRRPMVVDTKDKQQGPVAALMLTIVANQENAVNPIASLDERVEAAAALMLLQAKLSPSYQPDVALFQAAQFLTGVEANRDPDRTTQRWRHFATLLDENLKKMGTELPANSPQAAYHKKIAAVIEPVLAHIYDPRQHTQSFNELSRWLQDPANVPKSMELFATPK